MNYLFPFISFLFSIYLMAVPQAVVDTIRRQLERAKAELNNYKTLYQNEVQDNRQALQRIDDLENENEVLRTVNNALDQKIEKYDRILNGLRVPKGYKKYHQLKSPTTKGRRRAQFKRCLNTSIVHLHEIKNAQVKLLIGDKDVNLSWSQNELRDLRTNQRDLELLMNQEDIDMEDEDGNPVIAGDEDIEIEEITVQGSFPDPFLPDGEWNPKHLRRIIHILDIYHISHEAYHELRMTSRSVLPPIYKIKKEKTTMSRGINYYKCGTVRDFLFPMSD